MNDEQSEKLRQIFLNWAAKRDESDMSGYSEIEVEFGCFVAGYECATSPITPAASDPAILAEFTDEQIYDEACRRRHEFEKPQGG